MARRTPPVLLALLLALAAACAHAPAPSTGPSPPTAPHPLAADAVYHETLAAPVVYAWLDEAGLSTWTRERKLPWAPRGRPDFPTRLAARVASHRIRTGSATSALLDAPRRERRLAAWPNPWGALLGWRGEPEGRHLARITLRDDAVLGVFEAEREPAWSFVTTRGAPVAPEVLLAAPERLAAVYHVDATEAGHAYDPEVFRMRREAGLPTHAHRELVLVDPASIAAVEVGTPAVLAALARSVQGLEALGRQLADAGPPDPWPRWRDGVVDAIWPAPRPGDSPLGLYEAGLARPTRAYRPTPERLASLVAALRRALAAAPRPGL